MTMKQHILAALREEFDRWEHVLAGLSEAQISATQPSGRSIKDDLAHLWAWQQRSIARMEAGLHNREPEFPVWPVDPDEESMTDQVNEWIYESTRDQPWEAVYRQWHTGFLRLLELSEAINEPALLDGSRYAWLHERPLVVVLLGTYDHHHEHFEQLPV